MLFDGDLVGAFGGLSITQTRRRSVDTSFAGASLVYFHLQQRLRQSLAMEITIRLDGGLQVSRVRGLVTWKRISC